MKCKRCKKDKPDTEYSYGRLGKVGTNCLECKAYRRKFFLTEGHRLAKRKRGGDNKRKQRQQMILAAKLAPCTDCGQRFHPVAMDFDHVRGEKLANVSALFCAQWSLDQIQIELNKCELVCACCHRLRTLKRATSDDAPYGVYRNFKFNEVPDTSKPGATPAISTTGERGM